ncbi:flagellar brake protein [Neptuniibacter sp.]|uniref:flagellar brake protein n=1 Tax=Neptuniibacter sp. TaxID=1962643 RepID=UPI00260E6300|nr:flagellar brake protein [Neptuniibacter sp.]MCP4596270.1 flagellar brake protein [Neptuniibacter sp.]
MAEALEQLKNVRTLAELNPRIGEKVQIETRTPRGRYSVQLLGYREASSLMVSAPKKASSINEGARVTVRLMSGNYICAFSAKVLKIQSNPYPYWHLEYPKDTEVRRIRSHTRVPVNLVVSVDEYEPDSGLRHDWPVTSYCTDISIKGACVDAPVALGKVGDKLFVTTRFQVAGVDQVVLTPALIRSVTPSEEGITKVLSHGLEFLELDDETHLILTSFVYQQFLIETGHLEIVSV